MILFQDLLDLIVFANVPKPSVQLREYDQIDLTGSYIVQHPLKPWALGSLFAGGNSRVDIVVNHNNLLSFCPFIQVLLLSFQRQAVYLLLGRADTYIERSTLHGRLPLST